MNFIKRCPSCKNVNAETVPLCICGADLSGINAELTSPPSNPSETAGVLVEVKVCPKCSTQAEAFALLCGQEGCGESLDSVTPVQVAVHRDAPFRASLDSDSVSLTHVQKQLYLLVGNQRFECRNGDILGRAGTVARHVFGEIITVSNQHVALELRDAEWFLINLPLQPGRDAKNVTELDGQNVAIGASVPLFGEHLLKLSKRCEVRLIVATS